MGVEMQTFAWPPLLGQGWTHTPSCPPHMCAPDTVTPPPQKHTRVMPCRYLMCRAPGMSYIPGGFWASRSSRGGRAVPSVAHTPHLPMTAVRAPLASTHSAHCPHCPLHTPCPPTAMPCSTWAGTQAYPRPPTVRKQARLPQHGHISVGSHAECPCGHSFHVECPCEPVCTPLPRLGVPGPAPPAPGRAPRPEPQLAPRPSAAPTASGRTRR